jgi:virginiamycin B lyase
MTAPDRIRLIGLLTKSPAPAGLFYAAMQPAEPLGAIASAPDLARSALQPLLTERGHPIPARSFRPVRAPRYCGTTQLSARPPDRLGVKPLRLAVLLLVTVLIGCGDNGADGGAEAATAPAATRPPATTTAPSPNPEARAGRVRLQEYRVPSGTHPHDVAPGAGGVVWYTAQHTGRLGRLDSRTGRVREIELGEGSAPHGVIVGPDGAPWITDGGLDAIVRVDPRTEKVRRFNLPRGRAGANLNTATFDRRGRLWFTGQGGIYGRLDPRTGAMRVFDAPRGPGPYGIATTPRGQVFYASLAGSYIARINASGRATVLRPPTAEQGARRIWSDSRGRLWISEWNAGKLGRYDPATGRWREWRLPGRSPMPYAVYVDDTDMVWLTDFAANALVRFDPVRQRFQTFRLPRSGAEVRQLLGRPGELWGAESGTDRLVVARTT